MIEALQKLHALGPRIVIITSTDFSDVNGEYIFLYASQIDKGEHELKH